MYQLTHQYHPLEQVHYCHHLVVIHKGLLLRLITSKYQWAQLGLQWIHLVDVH